MFKWHDDFQEHNTGIKQDLHVQHNLPHVRVHAGNYLCHLSDMLDFKGTEKPGHHILNF